MPNLDYNRDMFYNVHKWTNEFAYLGVLVSGKLNQYNGQNYKLLDAIDIDWDGAYVQYLNSYINTTEDLINALNYIGTEGHESIQYIYNNYATKSELDTTVSDNTTYIFNYIQQEHNAIVQETLNNISTNYDILQEISNIVIDETKYLEIEYEDIVQNGKIITNRSIFIKVGTNDYESVDDNYILTHPDDSYYIFLIQEIIDFDREITKINNEIGYSYLDNDGLYQNNGILGNIQLLSNDITNMQYELDNTTTIANNAFDIANESNDLARRAYDNTYYNSQLIGRHSEYNVYKKIKDLDYDYVNNFVNASKKLYVYDQNTNSYNLVLYNSDIHTLDYYMNSPTDYYIYLETDYGYGIEREIELLEDKLSVVSNLETSTTDDESISIDLIKYGKDSVIQIDPHISVVDKDTGSITKGLINDIALKNSFSYTFTWEQIK